MRKLAHKTHSAKKNMCKKTHKKPTNKTKVNKIKIEKKKQRGKFVQQNLNIPVHLFGDITRTCDAFTRIAKGAKCRKKHYLPIKWTRLKNLLQKYLLFSGTQRLGTVLLLMPSQERTKEKEGDLTSPG